VRLQASLASLEQESTNLRLFISRVQHNISLNNLSNQGTLPTCYFDEMYPRHLQKHCFHFTSGYLVASDVDNVLTSSNEVVTAIAKLDEISSGKEHVRLVVKQLSAEIPF
jgi:hypothetical protein